MKKVMIKEYPETHQDGMIEIINIPNELFFKGDLGVQISTDGRIWVCINGVAFLRFKPMKGDLPCPSN